MRFKRFKNASSTRGVLCIPYPNPMYSKNGITAFKATKKLSIFLRPLPSDFLSFSVRLIYVLFIYYTNYGHIFQV